MLKMYTMPRLEIYFFTVYCLHILMFEFASPIPMDFEHHDKYTVTIQPARDTVFL
jgi:hypothetical protein